MLEPHRRRVCIQSAIRNPHSAIDLLLAVMAIIWGTNYSVIKSAFREIEPQAFNAARMVIASSIFLTVIVTLRVRGVRSSGISSIFQTPAPITTVDWIQIAALGLVGHFLYQYFFIGGLALTTVANSSLMLAATPVVIALASALLGQERVGPRHWAGAGLSMLGIYTVVGRGVDLTGHGLRGDLMMATAVLCWAIYTLGAGRLVARHSPVGVTGLSMAFGTLMYVPVMRSQIGSVAWRELSTGTWVAIVYSSLFALCVAYTIWYAGVREIGSARTSVYSNVIPIVAMATAVVSLGEPLSLSKVLGAAAVLLGVALTRSSPVLREPVSARMAPPEP